MTKPRSVPPGVGVTVEHCLCWQEVKAFQHAVDQGQISIDEIIQQEQPTIVRRIIFSDSIVDVF